MHVARAARASKEGSVKNRFQYLSLASIVLVAGALPAHAQTSTTAALRGRVVDSAGKPVAGARISLTSVQVNRAFTTDADGSFYIGLLNPGTWRVAVAHPGMQTSIQQISLGTNDTKNLRIKLVPEAATTVEVIGTASTIDTSTTQVGANFSMESLKAIPMTRDINDLVLLTPGAASSGFDAGTVYAEGISFRTNNPTIAGGSAAENTYIVDGLTTTDFRYGVQSAVLPPDFIETVEVQTGGFKPEYSALGGVFNVLIKSGSNSFKGSVWGTWDPLNSYAKPKSNEWFTAPQNYNRYDFGFEAGGPIIKDRVFFYVGADSITQEGEGITNQSGSVGSAQKITEPLTLVKVNGYLTPSQQLTLTWRYDPRTSTQPNQYEAWGPGNIGGTDKVNTASMSLNYDWTISPTMFLSLKVGQNVITHHFEPTDPTLQVIDFTQNGGTYYGGAGQYNVLDDNVTKQAKVDFSWMVGQHSLKFGVSYLQSRYTLVSTQTGGFDSQIQIFAPTDLSQWFFGDNSGVFAKFTAYYAQDTWEVNKHLKIAYGGRFESQEQYGQNGLPIFKFNKPSDYTQPRLGVLYDLNGDGKSKFTFNYAIYYESIPQRLAIRTYANETFVRYDYFQGTLPDGSPDPNNGYQYNSADPNHYGQVLVNGVPQPVYTAIVPGGGPGALANFNLNYGPLFSGDPIANGIKLPRREEIIFGYDQQVSDRLTLGLHAKYRKLTDVIEDSVITNPDGSPVDTTSGGGFGGHAILWNPNPNSVSWSTGPLNGDPTPHAYSASPTGFPTAFNEYKSVDFTWNYQSTHDALGGNLTWSRLTGNYEGVITSSNGQPDGNITSSFDYAPYYGTGLLPNDRTWIFKLYGNHRFNFRSGDLNLGFNFWMQSGTPKSLWDDGSSSHGQVPGYDTQYNTAHPGGTGPGLVASSPAAFNNPANWTGGAPGNGTYTGPGYQSLDIGGYGDNVAANNQIGQYGRTPTTTKLDLHFDYSYKLPRNMVLDPAIDIFNAFNTRQIVSVYDLATTQGGSPAPNYGAASLYQAGRGMRLTVKLIF